MNSSSTLGPRSGSKRFDLLTEADLSNLPDPKWIVDRLIPEAGLVAVVGAPGVGKTTLTVDVMMRVALGLPVFDRETNAGPVVYIAAEGVSGLKARAAAWKHANGYQKVDHAFFITEPVQLLQEPDTNGLLETIESKGIKPRLVVVDTLARCFEGGDENSAEAMGRLIGAAGRITKRLGATVLYNHHTRKSGDVERGSSALRGALDAMLMMTEDQGTVTVSCGKMKDAESFKAIRLRREAVANSCVLYPMDGDATNDDLTLGQLTLLPYLADGPLRASVLGLKAGLADSTCRRWLDQLVAAGLVQQLPTKHFALARRDGDRSERAPDHHHLHAPTGGDSGDAGQEGET